MAGKSINKVILIGNLGKDPEVKYTPQGTPVAKLTIATNERFKDKGGEWQDRTEWHNVVLWQRLADRRRLVVLAVVPLGAAAFAAYVALLTGDPAGYSGAQAAWGRDGIGAAATGQALGAGLDLLRASFLVTLLAYVFLFVFARADRIPLPYVLVGLLAIGAAFASGNLESIGRYGLVAFPFAWILAGRRSPAFRRAWPPVSAALGCVLAAAAFGGWYTP